MGVQQPFLYRVAPDRVGNRDVMHVQPGVISRGFPAVVIAETRLFSLLEKHRLAVSNAGLDLFQCDLTSTYTKCGAPVWAERRDG